MLTALSSPLSPPLNIGWDGSARLNFLRWIEALMLCTVASSSACAPVTLFHNHIHGIFPLPASFILLRRGRRRRRRRRGHCEEVYNGWT